MIEQMKEKKWPLLRVIVAALLFAIGLLLSGIPQIVVLLVSYVISSYSAIWAAFRNIGQGHFLDENFLMTIASGGALALHQWSEAAAVMLFYLVGELFENFAVGKSRNSIAQLMDLRPDYANLIKDGVEKSVDPYDVQIGDIILVKPGEKVPLDGIVIEGNSTLDTSPLTGESLPREIAKSEEILSGFINLSGVLKIRVTGEFADSTVSKILDLVENAGSKKGKIERFITKFAKYYTPAVVFSAIALAVIPPLFFGLAWSDWVYRGLLFLVISCPCALVISVPLSFFGGVGAASSSGVLVKGSNYLEALAKLDTVIFDKTGTLTTGEFSVVEVKGATDLLEVTSLAEIHSNHPIALSIKNSYGKEIEESRVTGIKELHGKGLLATVDGHSIYVGNKPLMSDLGLVAEEPQANITYIHVAKDKEYYGYISLSDTLKADSKEAIASLKALGVKQTVMLTGDVKEVGEEVAKQLGIDKVHTQLLPTEKVEKEEEIIEKANGFVAFVGDGINDAPVLARADVGVAMGALGSQAAVQAADVVIMDDHPSRLATVIKIARKTLIIAKENVIFALGVKGLILLLGALGFASMWMAIFADVGVSVIAILNAMRTLIVKK